MNYSPIPSVLRKLDIFTLSNPFSDIYQNSRFADFLIENGGRKVAIEIDDEVSHNPRLVSQNKFYDDLLKAVLLFADDKDRGKLSDIVPYFREFYEACRAAGLVVEKANSIYAKGGYTDAQAQKNILSNPFKRFEDMQMLHHTKTLGVIQVDESVWKKLTREEKQEIERICDEKLEQYYGRFQAVSTEGARK